MVWIYIVVTFLIAFMSLIFVIVTDNNDDDEDFEEEIFMESNDYH